VEFVHMNHEDRERLRRLWRSVAIDFQSHDLDPGGHTISSFVVQQKERPRKGCLFRWSESGAVSNGRGRLHRIDSGTSGCANAHLLKLTHEGMSGCQRMRRIVIGLLRAPILAFPKMFGKSHTRS